MALRPLLHTGAPSQTSTMQGTPRAKRDRKTIEAFCGWQESVYKRGYVSKAVEEASYSELLEYLKARLTPDEFAALLQRCRQEYYLRKSPVPCLKETRDTVTERRAVRKARDLLKKYPTG